MSPDLQEINAKLDLIIRSLGLDGNRNHGDITHSVEQKVIELRKRQLTRLKKKSTKEYVGENEG